MDMSGWKLIALAVVIGVTGGAVFWALARLALWIGRLLPARPPFAPNLLAGAGDGDRLRDRAAGRELGILLAGMLAILVTGSLAWLLLPGRPLPEIPSWALIAALVLAIALAAVGAWLVVRIVLARRQWRFGWAAKAAVGNILKRLNFAGNSVFHEVQLEGAVVDHVVVGTKGVFAVNVVARRPPTGTDERPTVELRNGKLWMAGNIEALPVGDAARNMTLLSGALSKVVGHRVSVRSVIAVPGWHSVPNGSGNHLVLNDSNLAMVTSWNTPDAYLMEEDCLEIQKFLHAASRVTRLD